MRNYRAIHGGSVAQIHRYCVAFSRTVNRLESVAFIGGCTDTNEFNYLVVKAMRSLGLVYLENQARV